MRVQILYLQIYKSTKTPKHYLQPMAANSLNATKTLIRVRFIFLRYSSSHRDTRKEQHCGIEQAEAKFKEAFAMSPT
jgi:hypothetical protein